jgi:hypothetical protein
MSGTQKHLERLAALLTGDTELPYDLETNDVALHFGGVNARGADLSALEQAKMQEAQQAPMKDIWGKTGWYKAPWDSKWRTWLDHSDAGFSEPTMAYGIKGLNPDSSIYKDYPQIKATNASADISPFNKSVSGSYDPDSNTLSARAPTQEAANSVGYHELEHKIQDIEGFAVGTSPDHPLIKRSVQAYQERYPKEYKKLKNNPRIAELLTATGRPLDDYLQHQLYAASAGEAEARLAQAWKGKSQDEVRKLYPPDEIPADVSTETNMSTGPKLSPDLLWREPDNVKLGDVYVLDKLADILVGREHDKSNELVEILRKLANKK